MYSKPECGEIQGITGLPEHMAQRLLNDTIPTSLLASDTPKGADFLRFPMDTFDVLPKLRPET
jgi:hypothetical protein